MDDKLLPAHILFAKWFIRIRWVALIVLVISNYIVKYLLDVSIQEIPIYILSFVLLALNTFHFIFIRQIKKKDGAKVIQRIKQDIHFQIITDLIVLTCILHYSGGIENPVILFYFFHMIIASSIFSATSSYFYAAYAIILASLLALLECYSVIPHYHLEGFVNHDLYKNPSYIFGAGILFTCASVFIVALSHMIIHRSIKSEESYVKTNLELENKDRLKNEYVLRVTHDIKGHVAAIHSCLEVIRSGIGGPLNDVQEEFTNRAYERTELLTEFVRDLLNLTKKRLRHDSEFEEFNLDELINKVTGPVQILAKDKSIVFSVFIDKSIKRVTGNPFMLEELYSNILLNAVKYTPLRGSISLTVKNRLNYYITEISDSGIGIPKEELDKVFDEFYRGSNIPKDIKSGSGLGLSIARQIVEYHNGKISASSELGIWTKFTFILPKNREFV